MLDMYGNYVIQKMFENGDQLQKMRMANLMEGKVLGLTKHQFGCRVSNRRFPKSAAPDQILTRIGGAEGAGACAAGTAGTPDE